MLGAALTIRACLPHFREQNAGHFLLTSSVAGRRSLPGSLYSCTKHAVTAMGESLRQEVAETDIKVTLIEPGMVDTPFFDNKPSGALEADDIARAVMFALDPAAARGRERDPRAAGQPAVLGDAAAPSAASVQVFRAVTDNNGMCPMRVPFEEDGAPPKRVLIADADVCSRSGLRSALEHGGLIVCADAVDVTTAVEAASREHPDAVLSTSGCPATGWWRPRRSTRGWTRPRS